MHIPSSPRSLACAAVVVVVGALGAGCGSDAGRPAGAPASSPTAASQKQLVVVPLLVGRRQDDAHRIVARAGLKLRWMGFTGKLGNGRYEISCVKVLTQAPAAGERRPRGASIAVVEAACNTPNQAPRGVDPGGGPGRAYDQ
jgi:hypothetical protein